jgi:HAD superfamily hydrolase (TIGR01509 family)
VTLPAAVFFDVDFTLIHPGLRFQAQGYRDTCAQHGVVVDPARFDEAVAGAASLLESDGQVYDGRIFEAYTQRIIELMGGSGPAVAAAARELFLDWAEPHHFSLYPDVPGALRRIHALGIRIGLISNTHRCLTSFDSHFELDGLISATVSSFEHGFMKPHPSIFRAALDLVQVPASEAVMVGDSLVHDVVGATQVGLQGVWLARGATPVAVDPRIAVIRSLEELPALWQG